MKIYKCHVKYLNKGSTRGMKGWLWRYVFISSSVVSNLGKPTFSLECFKNITVCSWIFYQSVASVLLSFSRAFCLYGACFKSHWCKCLPKQVGSNRGQSSCVQFLPYKCANIDVYCWWSLSLHHSRIPCCLVIAVFSYEAGEWSLHPLRRRGQLDAGLWACTQDIISRKQVLII